MKKILLFSSILIAVNCFSQNPAHVFASDSMVYYGLDFSNCRLIGDFGDGDGSVMKNKMFAEWNNVILEEPGKYNLKKNFYKRKVYYDLGPVFKRNQQTDEKLIRMPAGVHHIDPATIQQMVKNYEPGDKKNGIGLVFIIESFDKNLELATIHVTFFDVTTRDIFFSEMKTAKPKGAGLRNYWAKTLWNVITGAGLSNYWNWEKKYVKNR